METRIYNDIVAALQKKKREVKVQKYPHLQEMVFHIIEENPQFFYVANQFEIVTSGSETYVSFSYLYDQKETDILEQEMIQAAEEFEKHYKSALVSDYHKAICIHDYLKGQVEYGVWQGTKPERMEKESQSIIGAFRYHKCVCAGYAAAFQFLADRIGLHSRIVTGQGKSDSGWENHAWNMVQIEGDFYHVDVTWDAKTSLDEDLSGYVYFNVDDTFMARNHKWKQADYPICHSLRANYYVMTQCFIENRIQLERYLKEQFQMEEKKIVFKVKENTKLSQSIQTELPELCQTALQQCRKVNILQWHFQWLDKEQVYMVEPNYG